MRTKRQWLARIRASSGGFIDMPRAEFNRLHLDRCCTAVTSVPGKVRVTIDNAVQREHKAKLFNTPIQAVAGCYGERGHAVLFAHEGFRGLASAEMAAAAYDRLAGENSVPAHLFCGDLSNPGMSHPVFAQFTSGAV